MSLARKTAIIDIPTTSRLMLPMYSYLPSSSGPRMRMQKLGVYQPSPWPPNMISHTMAWYTTWSADSSASCGVRFMWFAPHFLFRELICKIRQSGLSVVGLHADLYGRSPLWRNKTLRYDISIDFVCPQRRKFDIFLQLFSLRRRSCSIETWMAVCRDFLRNAQLLDGCRSVYAKAKIEARKNAERKYHSFTNTAQKTSFQSRICNINRWKCWKIAWGYLLFCNWSDHRCDFHRKKSSCSMYLLQSIWPESAILACGSIVAEKDLTLMTVFPLSLRVTK